MELADFIRFFSIVTILSGCSSTVFSSRNNLEGGAGASQGGSGSVSGGSAGQGQAGAENDSGAGSGGSGGVAGAGSGGTGGSCNPKTCLTFAVQHGGTDACGIVEDGCGNFIDCEGCDTSKNPQASCSGGLPQSDATFSAGEESLCNGGCKRIFDLSQVDSKYRTACGPGGLIPDGYDDFWICTTQAQANPRADVGGSCVYAKDGEADHEWGIWCCVN